MIKKEQNLYIQLLNQLIMRSVVHRWVRQPNLHSDIANRVGNRANPFKNTLTVLQDPNTNRKLWLIGTTNSSTTLAYRTKKLINQVNPSAVYVQTTQNWWNHAKHTTVNNQEDFSVVSESFKPENYQFENNLRGLLWQLRLKFWLWSFKIFSRFPTDFTPFTPGLEIKYAIEQGERKKAKIVFGDKEFGHQALEALRNEPDMYPHTALWRMRNFIKIQSAWAHNYQDWMNTLHTRGGQAFAESCDRSRINFLVGMLNRIAPKQKKILVDLRGEEIFRDIYNIKQNNIVAVVNQWHMEAIETHWRRATGTEIKQEVLSPVADMDIDGWQDNNVVNEFLREYTSEVTHSEPATHQNHLVNYHKQNFEYERTRHTHHKSHEDVTEPGQKHKPHH